MHNFILGQSKAINTNNGYLLVACLPDTPNYYANNRGLRPPVCALHSAQQPAKETPMSSPITVAGVTLEVEEAGQGRPLLFLHPGEGLQPDCPPGRPWLQALARNHRVIAPHH